MQINFHSLLWSYSPRVPIFLAMTVSPPLIAMVDFVQTTYELTYDNDKDVSKYI